MANYWDTYNPGLLAGQDYWENFTPEAPTETGVVGAVTGRRYQPWERGYHNIAGLVDDSGEYDAWYDPDPPPETSMPDWGTPEGYENWKTRIGLETNNNNNSTSSDGLGEGEGRTQEEIEAAIQRAQGNDQGFDLSQLKDFLGSGNLANGLLGLGMAGPAGFVMGMYGGKISGFINSVLDGSYFSGSDTGSEITIEETGAGEGLGNTTGGDPDLVG